MKKHPPQLQVVHLAVATVSPWKKQTQHQGTWHLNITAYIGQLKHHIFLPLRHIFGDIFQQFRCDISTSWSC